MLVKQMQTSHIEIFVEKKRIEISYFLALFSSFRNPLIVNYVNMYR